MQSYSSNVIVLRQPRIFLRSYARCLFGFLLELELDMAVLTDKNGRVSSAIDKYLDLGGSEYYMLIK